MTFWKHFYEILMKFWWLFDDFLMKFWWNFDEILMKFSWNFYEIVILNIWSVYGTQSVHFEEILRKKIDNIVMTFWWHCNEIWWHFYEILMKLWWNFDEISTLIFIPNPTTLSLAQLSPSLFLKLFGKNWKISLTFWNFF